MKKNNKGFTLAELLIVVAIIAVLVAIAIPIFTRRLESSRETADLANLRGAYAVATTTMMADNISSSDFWYDPSEPQTGIGTAKVVLGKGTKVDGGLKSQDVPAGIEYAADTVAASKGIKIVLDADNASKPIQISFAD